ncbi:MAG: DUF4203 domain-containing protein [Anaerolineales bacterium]|nr:DUF4203 domain-containing protein [Chloroflexota bacterium]MBL6983059.1 DUF4203 domain-containing protein [Anaerolineales bacterium]
MSLLRILFGAALLAFGRKLYWLFVGALGFAAASSIATQYLQGMNEWLVLGIALGVGILGALLAMWVQNFAIGLAGFFGGGQIAISFLAFIGMAPRGWYWFPFLIGGVIGMMLVLLFFDWALIILSSLGGASLLTQAFTLPRPTMLLFFIILAVIGIMIQSRMMSAEE